MWWTFIWRVRLETLFGLYHSFVDSRDPTTAPSTPEAPPDVLLVLQRPWLHGAPVAAAAPPGDGARGGGAAAGHPREPSLVFYLFRFSLCAT